MSKFQVLGCWALNSSIYPFTGIHSVPRMHNTINVKWIILLHPKSVISAFEKYAALTALCIHPNSIFLYNPTCRQLGLHSLRQMNLEINLPTIKSPESLILRCLVFFSELTMKWVLTTPAENATLSKLQWCRDRYKAMVLTASPRVFCFYF